ncbi:hypothetical protein I6B53_06405 [Schaalia sp. 19OD2882]|uniref:DUF6318 family protein n=1 Tax=Schaalia sp. 19OD2882 TaxID=2794089 RepID=UPI001C1F1BED|nr:DUF6318 family protein [Schaalia sp. 19OD2882]QWW18789.1 hypothetical protein I6B53_06405 [Schaalia sp. 19OD2882]
MGNESGARVLARRGAGPLVAACSVVVGLLGLVACQGTGDGQSGDSAGSVDSVASGVQSGEVQMSGGYVVGPNGYLLQPDDPDMVEPVLPAIAKEPSVEGAEAFIHYYLDLLAHSWYTGDTEKLEAVSGNSCKFCKGRIETIEDVYAKGGWEHGLSYEMTLLKEPILADDGRVGFIGALRESSHVVYQNSTLYHGDFTEYDMQLQSKWIDGEWILFAGIVKGER